MKLVAVALLVLGMLCNSTLAMAEGPVPSQGIDANRRRRARHAVRARRER